MSFLDGGKDPMKPEELRNLFIFFVVATCLYFAYDAFFLAPQAEAVKKANVEAQQRMEEIEVQAQQEGIDELRPRAEILPEVARIKINNSELFGSIALKGARLDDLSLYNYYKTHDKVEAVDLLNPRGAEHTRYVDFGWVASKDTVNLPGVDSIWQVQGSNTLTPDSPVTLTWDNGAGLVFKRTYSLDDEYLFKVTQSVQNNSGQNVTLFPYGRISQTGLPVDFTGVYLMHEGPIGYIDDELYEIKYKTMRKENVDSIKAREGWVGVTDKYWLTAFIPEQGKEVKYNFGYTGLVKDKENKGRYQTDYLEEGITLRPGASASTTTNLYTGAKEVITLERYGKALEVKNLDLAVDFGIFWFMTKPFFFALHFLGGLIGNMGFAIIALTICIRGIVFPLTNASYKSFAKMKKVSPQVAELREKYGSDKQKLQQELMKLYQSEGVNPMAGCLPILVQIPIFFALYKTFYVTIEIRHEEFIGWIHDLSAPDPTSIFNLFGLIPWDPPGFLMIGAWPCAMLVAQLLQKKLNPPPQDPIQRDLANYFPFIITYVLAKFPSGLVIYWACSAWIGLFQQMFIMRRLGVPIHLFGETKAEKEIEDDIEHGGAAVHPLVEMAEDDIEDALFGEHDDEDDAPKNPKKKISKPKPKKSKKKK